MIRASARAPHPVDRPWSRWSSGPTVSGTRSWRRAGRSAKVSGPSPSMPCGVNRRFRRPTVSGGGPVSCARCVAVRAGHRRNGRMRSYRYGVGSSTRSWGAAGSGWDSPGEASLQRPRGPRCQGRRRTAHAEPHRGQGHRAVGSGAQAIVKSGESERAMGTRLPPRGEGREAGGEPIPGPGRWEPGSTDARQRRRPEHWP